MQPPGEPCFNPENIATYLLAEHLSLQKVIPVSIKTNDFQEHGCFVTVLLLTNARHWFEVPEVSTWPRHHPQDKKNADHGQFAGRQLLRKMPLRFLNATKWPIIWSYFILLNHIDIHAVCLSPIWRKAQQGHLIIVLFDSDMHLCNQFSPWLKWKLWKLI